MGANLQSEREEKIISRGRSVEKTVKEIEGQ